MALGDVSINLARPSKRLLARARTRLPGGSPMFRRPRRAFILRRALISHPTARFTLRWAIISIVLTRKASSLGWLAVGRIPGAVGVVLDSTAMAGQPTKRF